MTAIDLGAEKASRLVGRAAAQALQLAGQLASEYLRDPENVAGLAGAVAFPALAFRGRAHVPLLPWLAMSLIGDQVFRAGWRGTVDLRRVADAMTALELAGDGTAEPPFRCHSCAFTFPHEHHGDNIVSPARGERGSRRADPAG